MPFDDDMALSGVDPDRAAHERIAYDEGDVDEVMHRWHGRFPHVFASPNTVRHERIFDACTMSAVLGKRVVDLGCGPGASSRRLLDFGASHVLGIDISQRAVDKAIARAVPGRLDFIAGDVTRELSGQYDVVFGRSILHHIDFRRFLPRVYEQNLLPGGTMLFMEPLGGNLMVRLYGRLVPRAHTPDERSLQRDDLLWFQEAFPDVTIRPINYVTLPVAVITSMVWHSRADNIALRWADGVDERIARRPEFRHRFRQASIVIHRPSG